MASYQQGYDEERFATAVNQNFLCSICFNVLRNPVLCPKNQHCFCRVCITKYLQNTQRCPTCADQLTVETLTEPPRIVKDYLNELNIRCKFVNRGCQEIVQLQHLNHHEAACGFTPVVCLNQGCGVTVNKRDQIHHESELCEFRKLKCHSCGEMTKTLADIENKIEKLETNVTTFETKMSNMVTNMKNDNEELKTNMERKLEAVEGKLKAVEGKLEAVEGKLETASNEVTGLKAALIEGFDEMKEVLVKMEDMKEENARKVRPAASGDKETIVVVGGDGTDSVEMFNWRQKLWSPMKSLPVKRHGATSFVYNNHVTVAGGYCDGLGNVDNMIRMNIDSKPDLSKQWSECHVKLPAMLAYYSSVVYNNQLIVTGGCNANATSDSIDEVQLVPPYTVKTLSKMPEPRREHCTEILGDNFFILGGRTTRKAQDNLSSVVLYDIKKNECKQLAPLPYEVSQMATVRRGDNIVVIGGINKRNNALDTVVLYNVNTEQHHMLPSMRCTRAGSTAVVIGNNIVVLGGWRQNGHLKSVEAFNFDRYTWEELPEMSEGRWLLTSVVF